MPRPFDIRHWSFVIPPRRQRRRGGFALLITITLLAFLVLLLVSLAALTRVETQVASNNQHFAQARQNALLALNLALGQLQKHAGPDQRITARADLEGGETIPNARWTAAYGSAVAADYDQPPSAVAASLADTTRVNAGTGSQARLLNWLVSGNENNAFNPAAHTGASGEITASAAALQAGVAFVPATPVAGLDASATADSSLTIADRDGTSHPAILLVGPGSAQSAVAGGAALDFVAAPLVAIDVAASAIPGATGGAATTIGRYAWWVGDEGVKARADLPLVTDTTRKPAAFATAARDAVEFMDADTLSVSVPPAALNGARIGAAYDPAAGVGRALSLVQLPMASPSQTALRDMLRRRYHDLGVRSLGLLADSYAGGLRRDLTALLALGFTPPADDPTADTNRLYAPDPVPGTYPEEIPGYAVPTWAHLRSHYRTTVPSAGPDAGHLVPRLPVHDRSGQADELGVSPVLTYAALGMRYAVVGGRIQFNLHPLVVLWNPYTAPMRGDTYEAGWLFSLAGRCIQFQVRDPALPDTYENWQVRETRDMAYGGLLLDGSPPPRDQNTTLGIERYVRFRVAVPDLAPGESRVFTLAGNTTYGDSVADLDPCPEPLRPGLNPTTHAAMAGTVLPAGEHGWDYRVVTSANYMQSVPGRLRFDGAKFANNADQAGIPGTGSGLNTNGGIAVYLGATRDTRPDPTNREETWNPALNRWYQTLYAAYHEGNTVDNPLQEGPLSDALPDDEPALRTFALNILSTHGSNGDSTLGNIPRYRWLVHGNPRAPLQVSTRRDPTFATNHIGRVSTRAEAWPTWFSTDSPGDRASAGLGHDWHDGAPVAATLFEIRPDDTPLHSIGQLQQANLSLSGASPAWPVGNANADLRLPDLSAVSASAIASGTPSRVARLQAVYHDHSWLLNRALWDRWFFSTVPASGYSSSAGLPHPRLRVHDETLLDDPGTAAAGLLVEGAFNVNSTSEQAWRAVLGGVNQLAYDPATRADGAALGAAFSRFLAPAGDAAVPPAAGSPADLWQGYRVLTPEQIAQLARNLVAEIRARGPFVSVADFVNRRLVDNPGTTEDERIKGALQAAIDATYVTAGGAYAPNNTTGTLWAGLANFGVFSGYNTYAARGTIINPPPNAAFRRVAAFAPKFLTQGDVLSTIGSRLSARSDTFVVRTYGETVNPATDQRQGRAWCEAVVQRLPAYVDDADAPAANPPASAANRSFGRRFVVVSFRWLGPADL